MKVTKLSERIIEEFRFDDFPIIEGRKETYIGFNGFKEVSYRVKVSPNILKEMIDTMKDFGI